MFEPWQLIGLLGIPIGLILGIITEWRRKQHARHFSLSDDDRIIALSVFNEMRRRALYEGDVSEEVVLGVISYLLRYPWIKPRAQADREIWQAFKKAKKARVR